MAEALNLTPAELFSELHAGESVAGIADDHGVDLEIMRELVRNARAEATEQAIEKAVQDCQMSRDEADWLLEALQQDCLPRGHRFGRGFPGVRGGLGPIPAGLRFADSAPLTSDSSSL